MSPAGTASPALTTCARCRAASPLGFAYTAQARGPWRGGQTCPGCTEWLLAESFRKKTLLFVLFLAGSTLLLLVTGAGDEWWFPFNYAVLWTMALLLVIPHELSHALAGWLVGQRLYGIVLGGGPLLRQWVVAGAVIQLRKYPLLGLTYAEVRGGPGYRQRRLLVVAAGPLFHLAMLLLCYYGLADAWRRESADGGFAPVLDFMGANLLMLIENLLPQMRGGIQSDGAKLLQALGREAAPAIQAQVVTTAAWAGSSLLLGARQWQRADAVVAGGLATSPGHWGLGQLRALCAAGAGRLDQAIAELRAQRDREPPAPGLEAPVESKLAWLLLLADAGSDPQEILGLIERAYPIMPWDILGRLAWATAQALHGQPEEALKVLDDEFLRRCLPQERASAFAARSMALHQLGRRTEAAAILAAAGALDGGNALVRKARQLTEAS